MDSVTLLLEGFASAITPVIRMAVLSGFVSTLLYGGVLTLRGTLAVGAYSVLAFLTQRLLWPMTRLADMADLYQRAMASTRRCWKMILTPRSNLRPNSRSVATQ